MYTDKKEGILQDLVLCITAPGWSASYIHPGWANNYCCLPLHHASTNATLLHMQQKVGGGGTRGTICMMTASSIPICVTLYLHNTELTKHKAWGHKHMNNHWTTSPWTKSSLRCYAKSSTNKFWPIPGFTSCTRVTRRWRLLSHALNAVR